MGGTEQAVSVSFYFVRPDGHFSSAEVIYCANDQEAIETAKQYIDGRDIELWARGRFITKFKADKRHSSR
jgi:hypothetical protein